MSVTYHFAIDIAVVSVCLLWAKHAIDRSRRRKGHPVPPGPKGLPIIGNLLDMQLPEFWLAGGKWAKEYGSVVYLNSLGNSAVFLDTYQDATELLEKKGAIYSDRPQSIMCNELQGWDWMFGQLNYGEKWRSRRALLTRSLDTPDRDMHSDAQKSESLKLLANLRDSPENFADHLRVSMASLIMMITYGHEVLSAKDPYVELAETGVATMVKAADPMRYVPKWFPGAGFYKKAEAARQLSHDMRWKPYEETKQNYLDGTALPSFVATELEDRMQNGGRISPEDNQIISAVSGQSFVAGADTTVAALLTLFLAMDLNPNAQLRAQEELDRVVGSDRLPEITDRRRLPYTDALYKECMRWQPVGPIGVPHLLKQDDIYKGYFIPKGSMIIANQWSMTRDPVEYPDPDIFLPERYLPKDGQRMPMDPSKIAFGFGRRVCAGKAFADQVVFLYMARILSVFKIGKAIGPDGREKKPDVRYNVSGLIR